MEVFEGLVWERGTTRLGEWQARFLIKRRPQLIACVTVPSGYLFYSGWCEKSLKEANITRAAYLKTLQFPRKLR